MKEYNVVGLIDKVTIDLEDHYKDKLLSLADGSLDGQYRQRFLAEANMAGLVSKFQIKRSVNGISIRLVGIIF